MISRELIIEIAKETGIKAEAIEKDYVMNLILDAMAHITSTQKNMFLKGGTCIYKCFFHDKTKHSLYLLAEKERKAIEKEERSKKKIKPKNVQKQIIIDYLQTARLSKDLDITITPEIMEQGSGKIVELFREIAEYVKARHGLEIIVDEDSFPIHENQNLIINGKPKKNSRGFIHYKGPLYHKKAGTRTLDIDLTADEEIVFQPYKQPIYHPYSNQGEEMLLIATSYSFRDLFAEKCRALFEGIRLKDVDDIIFLTQHPYTKSKKRRIGMGLAIMRKFQYKRLNITPNYHNFKLRTSETGFLDAKSILKKEYRETKRKEAFDYLWVKIKIAIKFIENCMAEALEYIENEQKKGKDAQEINQIIERGIVAQRTRSLDEMKKLAQKVARINRRLLEEEPEQPARITTQKRMGQRNSNQRTRE